jgi:hypothetical protein
MPELTKPFTSYSSVLPTRSTSKLYFSVNAMAPSNWANDGGPARRPLSDEEMPPQVCK